MTLDFWLVARLAWELRGLLARARVQSLAATESGIILYCYRRGEHLALHASVDSNAPLVAVRPGPAPPKENGTKGWTGAVAALLRGATIDDVQAVPNDRVLCVSLSSRSAFGVPSPSRIIFELQPRKANAFVLRGDDANGWTIVAAAKQFAASAKAREVRIGLPYELPPPKNSHLDRAQFIVAAGELGGADPQRLARLLGEHDPDCTPALAREAVFLATNAGGGTPSARGVLDAWSKLEREVEDALRGHDVIFVAHPPGRPAVVHLVPLSWALSGEPGGVPALPQLRSTLNEICAEALDAQRVPPAGPLEKTLARKLATMLERNATETARLQSARRTARDADGLRAAGDAIYAHLTEIVAGAEAFAVPGGERIALDPARTPKENAADYFRRHKKARSGLPRIESRLRELRASREHWEQLHWELERSHTLAPAERAMVLAEVAEATGARRAPGRTKAARPSPERRVELSGGATATIGRSPKDNERLTFTVAGPNDYWFHVRGVPGAHVIVKSGGQPLSQAQIEEAAALAAAHSKASGSVGVEVDYTQRKHVRRQVGGRPGLVWYTDFKTVRVKPDGR